MELDIEGLVAFPDEKVLNGDTLICGSLPMAPTELP